MKLTNIIKKNNNKFIKLIRKIRNKKSKLANKINIIIKIRNKTKLYKN